MIFQMLSTLQSTDEQIEKSGKLEVTVWERVENIVIKGEITCFEDFHLLSECFQKASATAGVKCQMSESSVWSNGLSSICSDWVKNIW